MAKPLRIAPTRPGGQATCNGPEPPGRRASNCCRSLAVVRHDRAKPVPGLGSSCSTRLQIRPLGAGQFQVTFQLGGLQVIYQMQTPAAPPTFSLQEMVGFQCPEQL